MNQDQGIPDRPVWVTIQQAAEYLHVSVRTIRVMMRDGRLTRRELGPRVIRIDLREIDENMRPPQNNGDGDD